MITRTVVRALALSAMLLAGAAHAGVGAPRPTVQAAGGAAGAAGPTPPGLPSHVMLGLANGPGSVGWMAGSGAPWDARYQYLSGGVNTGGDWTTWNSPAGAFALYYMQDSGSHGYLPVFSYYELLQSSPASGATEGDKDYNNLNNAATMDAYYANFKLLMDQAHAYGKPVIVQVEPDLWGYLEQKAGACGQASCVPASVASSGYADVAAYPNTAQGFAEALLHLRDAYAPNVIMAIHASCWGSGADVCNYPTSVSDTASHAARDGAFLASAGIAGNQPGANSWDLVFTDTSDRDAGYDQSVYGTSHAWWDRTDQTLPNFANFRAWLAGVNAGAGRRIVLWQTPVGNQYFDTENNTDGHYQDNRAEYFLGDGPSYERLTSFANAGVVGVLFGRGAGGPTTYDDSTGDGVTNPAPVSSYQCNGCNTHVSQYSDDDGGYLRLFGGAYLKAGGIPVPGAASTNSPSPVGATATPASTATAPALPTGTPAPLSVAIGGVSAGPATVAPGGAVSLAATVTGNNALSGAIVDFEVYDASGAKVYQAAQSPVNLAANTPQTVQASMAITSGQPAGAYTLKVGVFGPGWSPLYAWNANAATFTVAAAASATSTPAPPTATATATITPVPPATTATSTLVPPTATATSTLVPPTATPTNTLVPPTATATNTPAHSTATSTPNPPTATSTKQAATASPATTRTPAPLTITWNRVSESATTIKAGATETFTATITSNQSVANELVDFEVYNSVGAKVWQITQNPVGFTANIAKRFTASWATPFTLASGTYTLRMGIFTSAWSACRAWDNSAATFAVSGLSYAGVSYAHRALAAAHVANTRARRGRHRPAPRHPSPRRPIKRPLR